MSHPPATLSSSWSRAVASSLLRLARPLLLVGEVPDLGVPVQAWERQPLGHSHTQELAQRSPPLLRLVHQQPLGRDVPHNLLVVPLEDRNCVLAVLEFSGERVAPYADTPARRDRGGAVGD